VTADPQVSLSVEIADGTASAGRCRERGPLRRIRGDGPSLTREVRVCCRSGPHQRPTAEQGPAVWHRAVWHLPPRGGRDLQRAKSAALSMQAMRSRLQATGAVCQRPSACGGTRIVGSGRRRGSSAGHQARTRHAGRDRNDWSPSVDKIRDRRAEREVGEAARPPLRRFDQRCDLCRRGEAAQYAAEVTGGRSGSIGGPGGSEGSGGRKIRPDVGTPDQPRPRSGQGACHGRWAQDPGGGPGRFSPHLPWSHQCSGRRGTTNRG